MYLWETIEHAEGYIVPSEEYNMRWNLLQTQGDQQANTLRDILQMLYDTIMNDTDGASHLRVNMPEYVAANLKEALKIIDTRIKAVDAKASLAITTSNTANAKAEGAVVTANNADAKADTAILDSTEALGKANTAIVDSADASMKADTVYAIYPDIVDAVASVEGKAEKVYIDQVAANFVLGALPNESVTEVKLSLDVQDKLNEVFDPTTLEIAISDNTTNLATTNAILETHMADLASQEINKGASKIGIHDAGNKFTATSVEGALSELFQSVSSGKQVIKTAITDKGVTVLDANGDGVHTHQELADGINAISIGKDGFPMDVIKGWSSSNGTPRQNCFHVVASNESSFYIYNEKSGVFTLASSFIYNNAIYQYIRYRDSTGKFYAWSSGQANYTKYNSAIVSEGTTTLIGLVGGNCIYFHSDYIYIFTNDNKICKYNYNGTLISTVDISPLFYTPRSTNLSGIQYGRYLVLNDRTYKKYQVFDLVTGNLLKTEINTDSYVREIIMSPNGRIDMQYSYADNKTFLYVMLVGATVHGYTVNKGFV